jgi:hypothetical protein
MINDFQTKGLRLKGLRCRYSTRTKIIRALLPKAQLQY